MSKYIKLESALEAMTTARDTHCINTADGEDYISYDMAMEYLKELGTVYQAKDIINRDEAVHELRQALYEHEDMMEKVFHDDPDLNFEDWFEHRIFVQQMNDIDVGIIKGMSSATGWIPVSERLPKYIKYYLITDERGHVTIAPFYISVSNGKSHFDYPASKVIAWMELPEAYVKEEVCHE